VRPYLFRIAYKIWIETMNREMTMDAGEAALRELYASLSARRRPEDVAETIRELLGDALQPHEARVLERAARGSLSRRLFGFTSMAQEFARPVGGDRQVARACELFRSAHPLNHDLCANPDAVEAFIRAVSGEIGKVFGQSDFRRMRRCVPGRSTRACHSEARPRSLFSHQRLQGRGIYCRVAGGQKRQPPLHSRSRRRPTGPVPDARRATSSRQ
jgi:hypothetical protein